MPKVTVILSSYNHAKFLKESIESVLNQTFKDFEIIIVDDASSDDSWDIIQSYNDSRIQAFRNKINKQNNFNDILQSNITSGEYIAIHHSDDVWELEKLQKQVDFLDTHPEMGAVFTHAKIVDENGIPFKDKSHFYYKVFDQPNRNRFEWLNYFYYYGNALCHPSMLIRRLCYDDIGLYRLGLAQIPDFDLWVRLCLKYEIYVIQEELVRFRVRWNEINSSGNRSDTRIRWQFENLQVLENYLKIPTLNDFIKIFPAAKKNERQEGWDIGYMLGRLALETSNQPSTQLFGLNLLWKAINDPIRARNISNLYGFNYKNLIDLTAQYDIFFIEEKRNLTLQLAEKNQELLYIKNSRSWKVVLFLRRILSRVKYITNSFTHIIRSFAKKTVVAIREIVMKRGIQNENRGG